MKKALAVLLKAFLVAVTVILASAVGVSILMGWSPLDTVPTFLFFGGALLMVFSGLVGAGFGERTLYGSNLYVMTSSYRNAVSRGRMERRDEGFLLMVVGFLMGLGLIGLSLLFALLPSG